MSKPKVFITRIIPNEGLDQIRAFCDATVWEDELPPSRAIILRETRDADGLVSLLTDTIDGELLDACPRLRVVSNYAVGFDNLDIPAGSSRGILMGNTPGVLTETTADFAFALLMAAARRIVEGADYVRGGQMEDVGTDAADGSRCASRDTRPAGDGTHRRRDGQARPWLRYARHLL